MYSIETKTEESRAIQNNAEKHVPTAQFKDNRSQNVTEKSTTAQLEKKENLTGMPDNLKEGIENLSGFSMDDVRVHYNSSKPATVQALAYTQGTDIHVAPGQEKHLPHEAWHVAQQMAGRVSPTTNINGMPVNDNVELEREADEMGAKAFKQHGTSTQLKKNNLNSFSTFGNATQLYLDPSRLNVVGEEHDESGVRRDDEKMFSKAMTGSDQYKRECEFFDKNNKPGDPENLRHMQFVIFIEKEIGFIYSYLLEQSESQLTTAPLKDKLIANVYFCKKFISGFISEGKDYLDIELQQGYPKMTYGSFLNDVLDKEMDFVRKVLDGKENLAKLDKNKYKDSEKAIKEIRKRVAGKQGEDEVRIARSKVMHEAAQNPKDNSGVWKVGDLHRMDIEKSFPKRNYNLVSRENFNSEFAEWEKNDRYEIVEVIPKKDV